MSDRNNERFSALIDGELDNFDQDLEQLSDNENLRQRWMRYHLIRDVISGHVAGNISFDVAAKVSQALENEPTILAPRRLQPQHLLKQAAGLAIAAAVSTVAIISIQNTSVDEAAVTPLASTTSTPATNPANLASIPAQRNPNVILSSTGTNLETAPNQIISNNVAPLATVSSGMDPKFSGYLVNHNEYSTSTSMQGMMPYMRIVGVAPTKPVVVRIVNEK